MGYVNLNGIDLRVKSIDLDPQLKSSVKPFVQGGGSNTTLTGDGGRQLSIVVSAKQDNIKAVQGLKDVNDDMVLISESNADYNGFYYLTGYKSSEKSRGIYEVTLTLQEKAEFNAVMMDFINYDILATFVNLTDLRG